MTIRSRFSPEEARIKDLELEVARWRFAYGRVVKELDDMRQQYEPDDWVEDGEMTLEEVYREENGWLDRQRRP